MGACTFAISGEGVLDNKKVTKGVLTFSASYATGGDTLDPKVVAGMGEVTGLLVESNTQGASVSLDATSSTAPKFLLYTGDGTQASNASDNSGIAVPVWLLGSS